MCKCVRVYTLVFVGVWVLAGDIDDSLVSYDNLDNWQQRKKKRMDDIALDLKKRKRVLYKAYIAELCIRCGCEDRTAKRYIYNFRDIGWVKIENNCIIWIAS